MDGEQSLIGAYRGPQESELSSYVSSPGPAITPGQHQTTKSNARAPPKRVARRGDDGTSEEDSPYVPSFRKPRAVHTLTREETAWSNVLFEKMGICGEDMDDDDDSEDSEEDKDEPSATKMSIIDNTAAMPMPSISEAVDEKAIVLLEAELSAAKEETAAISALLEISSKQKALLEEKLRHAEEECQQIRQTLDDKALELTTAGTGTGGHPDVAIKIELLNRQVSQLQASGERAEAARGVLAAQNAELKDQLCHLEAQLVVAKALAAAATQFTDTGGENAQEIEELKNSILQLKKELVGMQTAVHAADKTAIAAEARAANAMVREQDAQKRLSDAQGERKVVEQAYTDAVHAAEQVELEAAQLRTEISELQGEVSGLQGEILRLQNAADSSAAAHGAEIAVLKARLNATEAELQIVRQSYHDAQSAQTHLTEEISVLKEQVDSLFVANADIIVHKEAAEARALSAERREQEALQAASAVHEAKEAAEHAYKEAVQIIDQLKYDSAQLVTEVSELQTQITGLQAEISLLQGSASETAAAHGGEIATLEGKLSTAEAKLNSADAELHSVRHSCQIAEQASAQFAEEISVLTTKLADVIAVNTELQAEREALDVRATNAEAGEQQALEAASAANSAKEAAERSYSDAMQTVEQMKEQSAELRTEVAVLYGQIEGLQDENLQLQSASAEIATAHEAEVGKLEGKLRITAAQLQHAETELQTLRQQFDLAKQAQVQLTEEIAVLKGDLSASTAANALTTAERDTAQSHLTAANAELETLTQQTAAYEQALKSEVASLEDHLAIAQDTASAKEAELETEKAAGRAAVDALQKQRHEEVQALTLQLESVQEQLNYKDAEHAALNDKIQAVEAAAAQAASQHAALLLEAQKQRQEAEFNCAAARQQAAVAAAAIPLPPRSPPRTTFPMPVHALPQSTHASVWSRLVERKRSVDSSQLRDLEAGFDDFDADATDSASHDGDERGPLAALMMRLGAWQSAVRVAKVGDGVAAAVRARYYQQQRAIMLLAAVYLVVLHIVLVMGRLRSI